MDVPAPLPLALEVPPEPEVTHSPALSLFARPGDGRLNMRRVAVLAAHGVRSSSVASVRDLLMENGVLVVVVAPRIGPVTASDGEPLQAAASFETTPSVLYDGVVLADGEESVEGLLRDGRTLEFVKDQYRHCKTILALGASSSILTRCGIDGSLPGGGTDPGVLSAPDDRSTDHLSAFLAALGRHRHWERDRDPPLI
jgi:catalase